jgi:hypothetical protein
MSAGPGKTAGHAWALCGEALFFLDFSLHDTSLAQSMRFVPFFVAMTKKVRELTKRSTIKLSHIGQFK